MKKDIEEIKEELISLAEFEGTEVGEIWSIICAAHDFEGYIINDNLFAELETEIRDQYTNFKNNAELIEEEISFTKTEKRIEWRTYV